MTEGGGGGTKPVVFAPPAEAGRVEEAGSGQRAAGSQSGDFARKVSNG